METKCKVCGISLIGQQYRRVGDWLFCAGCFQKLVARPAEKSRAGEAGQEPWGEMETQVEVKFEKFRCSACNREIEGTDFKVIGDSKFCSQCYGERAEVEPDRGEAGMICKGCGRRVPKGESQELDGDCYCPECYHAIIDIVQEVHGHQQKSTRSPGVEIKLSQKAPSPEPLRPASLTCQSCLNAVPEGALKAVEGFLICQACRSSDAEAALEIARARHKKHLKRLREELAKD